MTDTLKVTVVATGLRSAEARPALTAVDTSVVKRPPGVGADYDDYDLPPGRRQRAGAISDGQTALQMDEGLDEQLFRCAGVSASPGGLIDVIVCKALMNVNNQGVRAGLQ
jgi:hypothetical protein